MMLKNLTPLVATIVYLAMAGFQAPQVMADDNWPQFRGFHALGLGSGNPPTSWNVESGENIFWKTSIEGLGHSSPIVWGDQVFLTTAVSTDQDEPELKTGWLGGTGKAAKDAGSWSWQVHCYNLHDGSRQWKTEVASGTPRIKRHLKATHANCTPATDGKNVIAFFGSEGLYCLDMQGKVKWKKDFGRLHSGPYNAKTLEWGFASSPVIHNDKVIVQCDCLNTAFVAVLDIETGNEILHINRDDVATWSTPAIVEHNSQTQIVCNGYRQMAGYDFQSGELLWTLSGGGDVPVPTPLFAGGMIVITNGHGRSPTYAVSPSSRGDISPPQPNHPSESDGPTKSTERREQEHQDDPELRQAHAGFHPELADGLLWYQPRDGSYMPTPIIVDGLLYTCNDNGRLAVRRLETGELVYKQRVGSGSATYSASAVATRQHIYFSDESGTIRVIRAGPEFELVAENSMDEVVMSTPAIAGDRLLVRTINHLVCIGK